MAIQPPDRPRVPLCWRGHAIGSVEPDFPDTPALAAFLVREGEGWAVRGDALTPSLGALAEAMRDAGLAHVWRNEQLAVRDASGVTLGSVERGVVRVLGIATEAVHLAAWTRTGEHWLQQRAFDKPTDPGLWDTLVGGMVAASDALEAALARETWEEAGLELAQFESVAYGGVIETRRPASEVAGGYVVERLHWYRGVLAPGVVPSNQDGEVAQFATMPDAEVRARAAQGEFTRDALLIFAAAASATDAA